MEREQTQETVMMKRFFLAACLAAAALVASAQQPDIEAHLKAHPELLAGTDYLCPTGPAALTKAPKGYKVFYISHYGRHGARYAWQSDIYDWMNTTFTAAAEAGNLTEYGLDYKRRFDSLYPEVRYRVGDLSRKGWKQQEKLAERMYKNFPKVFPDGAEVRAWTSTSTRCVMTMSAFCQGLKGMNPDIDLYENFGKVFLPAILPQDSGNPFRDKNFEQTPVKVPETWAQFIARTVDSKAILSRLFKDADKAVAPEKQWDLVSYLWFFAQGMNSLDTDLDFNDLFTDEELIDLWKVDNFQFYTEIWPTHKGYQPIVDDIIAKADDRIAAGRVGADLRFGHDYTILPLMQILDVNGIGHDNLTADEIHRWSQTYQVPMGANLQFVFYRSKKNPTVLFKVLLNGEEARLPLETGNWPYYDWQAFKARYGR
jgi:hypothetical protein